MHRSTSRPSAVLSIRIDAANPDHHLWNNHGTWWCHYTLHRGGLKRRRRVSLETRVIEEARARRDALFAALHGLSDRGPRGDEHAARAPADEVAA
ncbi:MAG: hypothetical protein HZA53_08045 [Planctomycetes bacterium]|nr:hypothetical protein [Planctomycetota bacterium]